MLKLVGNIRVCDRDRINGRTRNGGQYEVSAFCQGMGLRMRSIIGIG